MAEDSGRRHLSHADILNRLFSARIIGAQGLSI
jgi:hypothetical protein